MANEIKKILADLYEIDPDLKNHETELIKIINKIITSKPVVKIDKKFAKQLRNQLLDKTSAKKTNNSLFNPLIKIFTMKKIAYAAGGAVLTALIIIPLLNYSNSQSKFTQIFKTGINITNLKNNAFGSLNEQDTFATTPKELNRLTDSTAGLGAGPGTTEPRSQAGGGGGLATAESAMIMPPDYLMVNYKYIYDGEITLDQDQLAVLKKIKNNNSEGQLAGLLSNFNLGLADLSNFSKAKIQNISFTQDKQYGYNINVNLDEGSLTIYQDWKNWPQPNYNNQLKENDVPSDEKLIKIANDFIKKYNINLENYGKPIIDKNWQRTFVQNNKMYVPDIITIIYPLQINGKGVYEGHGYPIGINVGVNIRENKISNLTSLFTQNYQSSMYQAITDVEIIKQWIAKGGIFSYSYGNDKTYEVTLGDPQIGYFRKWIYKNGNNEEILIPALIFPISKAPEIKQTNGQIIPVFNKQNVVVPLIKEVLNEYEQQDDQPIPRPMPATGPIILEAEANGSNNDE